jgi:hypothetical protein
MNLSELSVAAFSKARMNSVPAVPSPPRQPGSTLNANLQMLSNVKRSRMSCKSNMHAVSEAFAKIRTSLMLTSTVTFCMTKFRSNLVLNSWLAVFLFTFQISPSELKIPRPRKSSKKRYEAVSFGVVLEVGLEHALNVGRVGGDDALDIARTQKDSGVCGAVAENFDCPVKETVSVQHKLGL